MHNNSVRLHCQINNTSWSHIHSALNYNDRNVLPGRVPNYLGFIIFSYWEQWYHAWLIAAASTERAMMYPVRGKVAYLVDTKVCIRVEVVVTRGHLIWAEEFGHLAPAGTGRQAGGMGCVWRSRRPRSMLDRRHRLGQRGGLCRLRRNYADWLRLWLRLLVREETTEERA